MSGPKLTKAQPEGAGEIIVLSIKLESGKFETSIRVPLLGLSPEQVQERMAQWLEMTQLAIRIGVTEMGADLSEAPHG